jgi:acetyl coenzyme A synthetase (ADP forming)-like protein
MGIPRGFSDSAPHACVEFLDDAEISPAMTNRPSAAAVLEPRSVAVVGANRERGKIGSEILHNLMAAGFTGRVAAVHPSAREIDGVPAFPRVIDIPWEVDLAVIAVPADRVLATVDDCLAKRVSGLVVISAGFGEIGAAGAERERELLNRVRASGVRMVGPNCMGVINTDPEVRLNVTFAPTPAPPGRVAMSTQSGALGLAILEYAQALHLGFSTFVSVGNKADVSSNDLLEYWEHDARTDVILLYLESFGNPRKFSRLARRVGRSKPIVAVKAGRSAAGARAAASHTGALASSDAIADALFRQCGVIRTATLEELFDVTSLLAHQPVPRGRRVAILTNAGGPGILAADACEGHGLVLPPLSEASVQRLRSFLPASASVANPVDMIASASAEHYAAALETLLTDDQIDSVLVIFIPPLVTREADVADVVRQAVTAHPGKTVAGIFMSAKGAPPSVAPVPCFRFPESAAVALARAAERGEWLGTPEGAVPAFQDVDRAAARRAVDAALAHTARQPEQRGWLAPADAQALLASVGIPTVTEEVAPTEAAAVAAADRIGYPVALKVLGPTILHKSDVGGVVLDLPSAEAVAEAWRDLRSRLGTRMTGALVQEMAAGGVEMLVGAALDPTFGPVVGCAMGGTLAELLSDAAFRLHPLRDRDAVEMVAALRGAPLLRGYRGAPAADRAALHDCLLRVSALLEICPEIQEMDINPLRVLPRGAKALDARVRID